MKTSKFTFPNRSRALKHIVDLYEDPGTDKLKAGVKAVAMIGTLYAPSDEPPTVEDPAPAAPISGYHVDVLHEAIGPQEDGTGGRPECVESLSEFEVFPENPRHRFA